MDSKVVGVLGGGQLGRMMSEAGSRLGIPMIFLDSANSPAKQINANHVGHIDGSFSDPESIRQLASKADVLTVEIEHVNAQVLAELQNPVKVFPSAETIMKIQDKYIQKTHLLRYDIPVTESLSLEQPATVEHVDQAVSKLGLPLMLKSRTMAYDGRGNFLLKDINDVQTALEALGVTNSSYSSSKPPPALYAEKFAKFVCEIAVMVVRNRDGQTSTYPAVETVHQDNICHVVNAPLRKGGKGVAEKARSLATKAVASFGTGAVGAFGVEMFLCEDGELLINEIAPRPHNSGHYTIEACDTSQFENHLRAILGLPLGSTKMKVQAASMLNILGFSDDMNQIREITRESLLIPGSTVHLYGKASSRKARKMGHVTIVGSCDEAVANSLDRLDTVTKKLGGVAEASSYQAENIIPGSSSKHPLVSVIMGSDSDLPVMKAAAETLDSMSVPYELQIVSAHRTPHVMYEFAENAKARGVRVIIAGAGGAAHLPGMVAALTTLPVIGVPVKGSSLDGVDSLHSIVQMPKGVPVATVAINNSTNAGLLAIRILSTTDTRISSLAEEFKDDMKESVEGKRAKLSQLGWREYLG